MNTFPVAIQIALLRARMLARKCKARAVDLLIKAGVCLAHAVKFVAVYA